MMEYNFTTTFLGLIFLGLLDVLYFQYNKDIYDPILSKVKKINYINIVLIWLIIIVTIQLLILSRENITEYNSFKYGAILGFGIYCIYNLIESLYNDKWNNKIITIDTIWGVISTGSASYIMFKLQDSMKY